MADKALARLALSPSSDSDRACANIAGAKRDPCLVKQP